MRITFLTFLLLLCSLSVSCARKNDNELDTAITNLEQLQKSFQQESGIELGGGEAEPSHPDTVAAIEAVGGSCLLNTNGEVLTVVFTKSQTTNAALKQLAQMDGLDQLGNLVFSYSDEITDDGLKHLNKLTSIIYLALPSQITVAGLKYLKPLTELRMLAINGCDISDQRLQQVAGFSKLEGLMLMRSNVKDEQLMALKSFQNLRQLGLESTQIGDKGLKHLSACTNLKSVFLSYTKVTDEGLKNFQRALPGCQIKK